MPNLKHNIQIENVLGEQTVEKVQSQSAEEFLRNFPADDDGQAHRDQKQLNCKDLSLLKHALITKYQPIPRTGIYLGQKSLQQSRLLQTGLKSFDATLKGGFLTGELTEVYGSTSKGKTQMCHHLAAQTCIQTSYTVFYIHTNNSFSSKRLVEILRTQNVTDKIIAESLENVNVHSVLDVLSLQELVVQILEQKKTKGNEFYSKLRLVIVDCITAVLSPIIGYKRYEGVNIMRILGSMLKRLAVECNTAVVVVNGTVTGGSEEYPKAALGVHWPNITHNRILIQGYNSSVGELTGRVINSVRLL